MTALLLKLIRPKKSLSADNSLILSLKFSVPSNFIALLLFPKRKSVKGKSKVNKITSCLNPCTAKLFVSIFHLFQTGSADAISSLIWCKLFLIMKTNILKILLSRLPYNLNKIVNFCDKFSSLTLHCNRVHIIHPIIIHGIQSYSRSSTIINIIKQLTTFKIDLACLIDHCWIDLLNWPAKLYKVLLFFYFNYTSIYAAISSFKWQQILKLLLGFTQLSLAYQVPVSLLFLFPSTYNPWHKQDKEQKSW